MAYQKHNTRRTGGIYIAVLGTSMIIALLGLAALLAQRVQNRMLVAVTDIRQAQLNANTAVELALLTMKQDTSWRTNYASGNWFVKRALNIGSCTVNVTDPVDTNLANNADDPIVVLGIGYSGKAEQRVEVTVDPRLDSLSCLRSAVAAGGSIDLSGDTLRTGGLITANDITATGSQVYGKVEALVATGSTYNSTPTVVTSDKRPTMPDWTSAFSYYRTNGTQIVITSLPTTTPNLCRNISFDTNTQYWTGTATGLPTASISRDTGVNGHSASLRAYNRTANTSGASQYIDHFVKSGGSYNITLEVAASGTLGNVFRVKLATKSTTGTVQTNMSSPIIAVGTGWQNVTVTIPAPTWTGQLEYARLTVDSEHFLGRTDSFYIDNIDIRENTTGRFIYRVALGPGLNPFGSTNSQGVYWIDCKGARLVIERSRIQGTLLVVNPGAGSCIGEGPISWSPAVAGYPALLVDADTPTDADFEIDATNRCLSEADNGVNFNVSGVPHDDLGTDSDFIDIYRSSIRGLIAIRDDLTFNNRALVRGQIVVGDDINTSSGELEVENLTDSLLNAPPGFTAPYVYVRRPTSIRKVVLP